MLNVLSNNRKISHEELLNVNSFILNKIKEKAFVGKNDKETFKYLFNCVEAYIDTFSEDELMQLDKEINIPELVKLALFLKYKKGLNIKEKIKLTKDVFKDSHIQDIIFIEKLIWACMRTELSGDFENKKESLDITRRLICFNSLCVLVKSVMWDFHKKDIVYFENQKPKYKITKIKNIINSSLGFLMFTHLDKNDIDLDACKLVLKGELNLDPASIERIAMEAVNPILRDDEYNKALFDKEYLIMLSNRLSCVNNVTSFGVDPLFMMKRKILIPRGGVILLIEDENSKIESILVKEKMFSDINNICFVTRYKDGSEIVNSIIVSDRFKSSCTVHLSSKNDKLDSLDYLCNFLEIDNPRSNGIDFNYSVIAPGYWKYRKNNYISSNDKIDKKGVIIRKEFEIEVAPFIRKINGQPSQEALKLAKQVGVELEDNYTIVKPHTRTYNKRK